MAGAQFATRFDELPRVIPIFPLGDALLLPGGRLPLNIFEPRYLTMTLDALGLGRIIGMVRPLAGEEGLDEPRIYGMGCAGRISAFSEADDGRLQITLAGVCRFRVAGELGVERGYRRAVADYRPFRDDLVPLADGVFDRRRLIAGLAPYFEQRGISLQMRAFEGFGDAALVTAVAMLCPFAPEEMQALLEAPTASDRANLLIALIEMGILEGQGGGTLTKQ